MNWMRTILALFLVMFVSACADAEKTSGDDDDNNEPPAQNDDDNDDDDDSAPSDDDDKEPTPDGGGDNPIDDDDDNNDDTSTDDDDIPANDDDDDVPADDDDDDFNIGDDDDDDVPTDDDDDIPADDDDDDVPTDDDDDIPADDDDDDVTEGDPAEKGSLNWTTGKSQIQISGGFTPTNINLELFIPEGSGPYPVIVFTHGFQLKPSDYTSYGQHLASWGYIVVMPEMPGSMIAPKSHRELKEYLIKVLDWVEANASDANGPLKGKADTSKIGVSGHSMGGKISLLVATEDARPKASFTIDPVDAGSPSPFANPADYPSVTPELMPKITIPLGLLGETVNATGGTMGQSCAPADNNFQQYYKHAESPALEIEVLGANHMDFLDNPNCGVACNACPKGTADSKTTIKITRKYLTAFYNLYFYGMTEHKDYLTGTKMEADVAANLVKYQHKNGF